MAQKTYPRISQPVKSHLLDVVGKVGPVTGKINVLISMDIIALFSEGLYQSPHKALEELVSNSYDAGASQVHVLVPEPADSKGSLWVIDNGVGMDAKGLQTLWQVARSPKSGEKAEEHRNRKPIGQFGIGKLAAYVLAWRLTHISKISGKFYYVSMNFHDVTGRQWEPQKPLDLDLHEVVENDARSLLSEIEGRDSAAWNMMFGPKSSASWTAAALSDFRDLASKLRSGTLGWVLRTGLPLAPEFAVYLNGTRLTSPRTSWKPLEILKVGGSTDAAAQRVVKDGKSLDVKANGIEIPGIGAVTGEARIYKQQLTTGKASQVGRSHGFFIRVRGRVINLGDELFGLDALNHAAWSRFTMTVDADGLRDYLQSSREGVRDSTAVTLFRDYLHQKFNDCRAIYQRQLFKDLVGIDLERLLQDSPPSLIRQPLLDAVRSQALDPDEKSYYIRKPVFSDEASKTKWLGELDQSLDAGIFARVDYAPLGPYGELAQYDVQSRLLTVNSEHPLIQRMTSGNKDRGPATLFAQAEILMDPLLRDLGINSTTALELLLARDRILRALTGQGPVVAAEAIRLLSVGNEDETAMERAVGYAFEAIGFRYAKRSRVGGQDGIIDGRLGLRGDESANYRAVFDAKTTDSPKVAANDIPFSRIKDFQTDEHADFSFVVGKAFQGEENPQSSVNRSALKLKVSLLKTDDVRKLLELHLKYGVTLVKLRELFDGQFTVPQTRAWIEKLESEVSKPAAQVPLLQLLKALDLLKDDPGASPTVYAARERAEDLRRFKATELTAALHAMQTIVGRGWIDVKSDGSVYLDQSPEQIVAEVQRVLKEDLKLT